jgi:hypothetical protein
MNILLSIIISFLTTIGVFAVLLAAFIVGVWYGQNHKF